MTFLYFFTFLVIQRLAELLLARRNEAVMKKKGAVEFGKAHYKYIVSLHIAFLLSVFVEVIVLNKPPSPIWTILFTLFICTQLLRAWAITSLGIYWNTKIIILPNAIFQPKGPYKWLRHPNYVVVVLELLLIPLLFQAYITAWVFSLLNAWLLWIRIREEERALQQLTNYRTAFQNIARFIP